MASGVVLAQDKPSVHLLPPRQLPTRREAQWAAQPAAADLPCGPGTPFLSGGPEEPSVPPEIHCSWLVPGTQRDAHTRALARTGAGTAGRWAAFPARTWGGLPPSGPGHPTAGRGCRRQRASRRARGWGCDGAGSVTGMQRGGSRTLIRAGLLFAPRGPQRGAGRCRDGRGRDEDAAADNGRGASGARD